MDHYGDGPAGSTRHVGAPSECSHPGCAPRRTAAATAVRMRARQDRLAAELRGLGWGVITPESMREQFALIGPYADRVRTELEGTIMGVRHG